jgi:hypothetical protein
VPLTDASRTYYRACVGRWSCTLDLAITDWEAYRAARLSALDRLRVRSSLLMPARFSTTVAMPADDTVIHTTRVTSMGVPALVSREVIKLDPDGARFALEVEQRDAPLFLLRRWRGHGFVDTTGTRATYHLELFGIPMLQTTLREEDLVIVTQETEFSRGVQRLVRRR